jgi:hypothetical protein
MRQSRLGQLALVTTLAILVCRFIAQPETAAAQSVTALNFGSPAHGRPKAVDPGPRGGAPGAGGPLTGVGVGNQQLFAAARARFQEIDSVSGTMPGETGVGLARGSISTAAPAVMLSRPSAAQARRSTLKLQSQHWTAPRTLCRPLSL